MDDFYLPRKIMRPIAAVMVLTALAWGIISGDMTNVGKLLMKATQPIAERIENRMMIIINSALPVKVLETKEEATE